MAISRRDLEQLFQTTRALGRVWRIVFAFGVYSTLPVFKEYTRYAEFADIPSGIFGIFGAVLSIILVFRTNRAYDRWWEARTLWGKQVNISRNLAIKVNQLASLQQPERIDLHRSIAGFAYALKDHLRQGATLQSIPGWESAHESPVHVPGWLSSRIYQQLKQLEESNRLRPEELIICDTDAHEFLNVCGGCERIRNTLITGSYRSYALKCLFLYLLTLPWGLVHDLNWLTIPITMIISYFMFGLEIIADDVEQPFGYDLDDLDLESLCLTIDRTTAEILNVSMLSPD